MRLILGLIVGRVEVVTAASEAGFHDCQVLIRQCKIDDKFGFVGIEERFELVHVVCIHLGCLDIHAVSLGMDGLNESVALGFAPTCNHQFREDIGVLCHLKGCNGGHTTGSYHQYSTHIGLFDFVSFDSECTHQRVAQ